MGEKEAKLDMIRKSLQAGLVVPTGNPKLDPHIGGGFPKQSITSILARNHAAHRVAEVLLNGAVSRVNEGDKLAILADIRAVDDAETAISAILEAIRLDGVDLVVVFGFDALRTIQWKDCPGTQKTYQRFVKVIKGISKEVRKRDMAFVVTDAGIRIPVRRNVLEGHPSDPCMTHEMMVQSDLVIDIALRSANIIKNRWGKQGKHNSILQAWIDPKRRPSPQAQAGAKRQWECPACGEMNLNNTMCWQCGQEYRPPDGGDHWDDDLWSTSDDWDSAP